MPAPAQNTPSEPGRTFGKYRLVKRIALGGMAEVYLARLDGAAGFSKQVVIKKVLPAFASTPNFIEMFLDEGRLAARLSHPNIAQTFELGEIDGCYYLAMEYVLGESLLSIGAKGRETARPFPLGGAMRVMLQLLDALDYAHALRDANGEPLHLIHRDVTPSNVMVSFHGGVKLLDFGIARARSQTHETQVGIVKGKMGYMAPEQCRIGPLDHRVDLFTAGALLYSMVVGRAPYEDGNKLPAIERIRQMAEGRFPRPRELCPWIPDALEKIILRAMAPAVEDRYPTAGAMLRELESFAGSTGLLTGPHQLAEYLTLLFPDKATSSGDYPAASPIDVSQSDIVSDSAPIPVQPAPSSLTPFSVEVQAADPPTEEHASPLVEPSSPGALEAEPATEPEPGARRRWVIPALGVLLIAAVGVVAWASRSDSPPRPRTSAPPPAVVVRPPAPEPAVPPAVDPPPSVDPPPPADVPEPADSPEPTTSPGPAVSAKEPTATPAKRPAPRPRVQPGVLSIDAYPWVKVKENGRQLGVTPFRVDLAPGPHRLALENEAAGVKKTISVTINPGEETKVLERLVP